MVKKLHIVVEGVTYIFDEEQMDEIVHLIVCFVNNPDQHTCILNFTPTPTGIPCGTQLPIC